MPADPSLMYSPASCSVSGRLSPEMNHLPIKMLFVGKPELED